MLPDYALVDRVQSTSYAVAAPSCACSVCFCHSGQRCEYKEVSGSLILCSCTPALLLLRSTYHSFFQCSLFFPLAIVLSLPAVLACVLVYL
jgi:hypothetical protein